jgi:4-hydroxybenzoate polyprenyltransferase
MIGRFEIIKCKGLVDLIPASISNWLGLIRFSHTIFALPFACLATVMAYAVPLPAGNHAVVSWPAIAGVLGCMVFARSTAMAFNRLVDCEIDRKNPRTSKRHIPAGVISVASAWWFTAACSAGFVLCTLLFWPNWLPLAFSVPVLLFLCGYSLAKRFTFAAHAWLGVALSLSPLCVWLAIRGPAAAADWNDWLPPLLLAAGIAAWVTGFDIIYACQDAEYDSSAGLQSVPAKFGIAGALRIAMMSHLLMLLLMFSLPFLSSSIDLGWIYFTGMTLVAFLVLRQHLLVSVDDLDRVNEAFFTANAWISVILLVFGSLDTLMR